MQNETGYRERLLGPSLATKVTRVFMRVFFSSLTIFAAVGLFATVAGWKWFIALDWEGYEEATRLHGFIASSFLILAACVGFTAWFAVRKSAAIRENKKAIQGDPMSFSKATGGDRVETVYISADFLYSCIVALHDLPAPQKFEQLLREVPNVEQTRELRLLLLSAKKKREAKAKNVKTGDTIEL